MVDRLNIIIWFRCWPVTCGISFFFFDILKIPKTTRIIESQLFKLFTMIGQFLHSLTVAVWLVADFEALSYQVTTTFDTSCIARICTAPAINYTACQPFGVHFSCHFSFNLLLRFCLPCVGAGTLFDKFRSCVGLCDLAMCVTAALAHCLFFLKFSACSNIST